MVTTFTNAASAMIDVKMVQSAEPLLSRLLSLSTLSLSLSLCFSLLFASSPASLLISRVSLRPSVSSPELPDEGDVLLLVVNMPHDRCIFGPTILKVDARNVLLAVFMEVISRK